jgi:hypothetical protein
MERWRRKLSIRTFQKRMLQISIDSSKPTAENLVLRKTNSRIGRIAEIAMASSFQIANRDVMKKSIGERTTIGGAEIGIIGQD